MCALDTQEVLSEDKGTQEEADSAKLVPVIESIRYHRRAQIAEKRAEELTGELAEARAEAGSAG
jgi:hypothetical protein